MLKHVQLPVRAFFLTDIIAYIVAFSQRYFFKDSLI